jgi:hypothetical protein
MLYLGKGSGQFYFKKKAEMNIKNKNHTLNILIAHHPCDKINQNLIKISKAGIGFLQLCLGISLKMHLITVSLLLIYLQFT